MRVHRVGVLFPGVRAGQGGERSQCRGRQRPYVCIKEKERKAYMPRLWVPPHTVEEAAAALGVAPRTVRRLLQEGRVGGRKLGREWVVWWPGDTLPPRIPEQTGDSGTSPSALRRRLRQVGAQLIVVGNQAGGGYTAARAGVSHLAHAAQPPGHPGDRAHPSHPRVGPTCARGGTSVLAERAFPLAPGPAAATTIRTAAGVVSSAAPPAPGCVCPRAH